MSSKPIIDQLDAFQSLIRYVRLSRLVKDESLLQGEHISAGALDLKNAMDTGDANHAVFSDKNCQLYLLYLLKNNQINEIQFLTTYLYLSVLMQFTEKQPIHPDHMKTRRLDWGDVEIFTPKDSLILAEYAELLSKKFNGIFTKNEIIDYYASLTGSESWMIAVPYNINAPSSDDVKKMTDTNLLFSPILKKIDHEGKKYYLIPSMSFANWMLEKINPERQIRMAPCFGNIGTDTLFNDFHSRDKHPVTIHSPFIKSNPLFIHEMAAGPVPFALHDVFFHCFGATAFNKNEYGFIMNELIPALQTMVKTISNPEEQLLTKKMMGSMNDLAINLMRHLETDTKTDKRLQQYLSEKLFATHLFGSNAFGQLSENEMKNYFMVKQKLCQLLYEQKDKILNNYGINIHDLLKNTANMEFINDIEFDSEESYQQAISHINKLLDGLSLSSLSNEEIKMNLTKYLSNDPESCIVINRAGFPYLPPLYPFPDNLLNEALLSRSNKQKETLLSDSISQTLFHSSSSKQTEQNANPPTLKNVDTGNK